MSKAETALSETVPLSPERLAFSIQEVAEALGVSRDIINDMIQSKQLRSLHVGRGTLYPGGRLRTS